MGSRVSWCCGNTVRFNAIPPSSRWANRFVLYIQETIYPGKM
jgi:hypothetical protein